MSSSGGRGSGIKPGDILVSTDNQLGPGKAIEAAAGDKIVLEYFDTPGQAPEDRYRDAVARESLKRARLSNETRVFWETDRGWRSGRVLYTTSERDIVVKGYEWEGFVDEEDLFVRWQKPHTDPVGFAEARLLESPLLADRRRPFLQHLLRQRAAARGMGGLISSCIELHAHQLEIARRVLEDPVQRYLLADEVGLGKTIEAGIIIRQLLLEDPELSVQLILPPYLVSQWKHELTSKFLRGGFPSSSLRWSRNDRIDDWEAGDLVVVDEAHHLARMCCHDESDLAERFERLRRISHESPRLLLLSATPVLHNERVFLAMLHLLEPDLYGLDDVAGLRERVNARTDIGRVLLGLRGNVPAVLLKRRFKELRGMFPADDDLKAEISEGIQALEHSDDATLEQTIRRVRVNLSERYRLHRRMLRTRRTAALESTFQVAGRSSPVVEGLPEKVSRHLDGALETWRRECLAEIESTPSRTASVVHRFKEAFDLLPDTNGLVTWAEELGKQLSGGLSEAFRDLASIVRRIDVTEDVARPVADYLSYAFVDHERMVVFCPTADLGGCLAECLREYLGEHGFVVTHLASDSPDEAERALRAFESSTESAQLLVADSTAEEGRNLQFADVMVHVGLPSDPNRMEQRIGRLDRWSRSEEGWRSIVVGPAEQENDLAATWHCILEEGFGVLETSIATLQHVVDDLGDRAWEGILRRGTHAKEEITSMINMALEEELEEIRQQDALDAIEAVDDGRSVFAGLLEAESKSEEFAKVSDNLFARYGAAGNLRFERRGDPVNGTGTYRVRPQRNEGLLPLLPTWRMLRDFVRLEGHVGTFDRDIAVERPGVRLYRFGDEFIEAVADFLWHDDRGRAWGMWRWEPGWTGIERPWFRYDFHLEVDADVVLQSLRVANVEGDLHSITRRGDAFLPPAVWTLWLDEDGNHPDQDVLRILERPYEKASDKLEDEPGGDFNLSLKRLHWTEPVLPADEWASVWRRTEQEARDQLLGMEEVSETLDVAETQAKAVLGARLHQIELRLRRAGARERRRLESEVATEEVLTEALIQGIRQPRLRLDSVGVVIISGEGAQGPPGARSA